MKSSFPLPCLPSHLLAQVLWLHIALSDRFDAAGLDGWQQRLREFLSHRGLLAVVMSDRIAVIPVRRPLAHFDRGLVMGWLLAQPEVVFVRVERRLPLARPALAGREMARV